jgi:hypothetical protein
LITDCQKKDDGILISGFEQYRNMDFGDKENRKYQRFIALD